MLQASYDDILNGRVVPVVANASTGATATPNLLTIAANTWFMGTLIISSSLVNDAAATTEAIARAFIQMNTSNAGQLPPNNAILVSIQASAGTNAAGGTVGQTNSTTVAIQVLLFTGAASTTLVGNATLTNAGANSRVDFTVNGVVF